MGPTGKVNCNMVVKMDYRGCKYFVCGSNFKACGKSDKCFDVEEHRAKYGVVIG